VKAHHHDAAGGYATGRGRGEQTVKRGEEAGRFTGLDLDEDFTVGRKEGEDIFESGDAMARVGGGFPGADVERLELRESGRGGAQARLARGGAAGVGIVKDGEAVVAGEADIELEAMGAGLQREAEGGERVFRRERGGAAMGDDFHRSKTPNSKKILDKMNRINKKIDGMKNEPRR
jgi:hypothetical protein